ncbi:hypothetical protein FACS1894219_04700 [Clostridia bacterium]|nr:hypothetical protein FACS1894219_04700 [Clostridia bacterium]
MLKKTKRAVLEYSNLWLNSWNRRCESYRVKHEADIYINDPARFLELPKYEQAELLKWITETLFPRKTINHQSTSYGLKHFYENTTRNYVTNGQFKGGMIAAGFAPVDATALNARYRYKKLRLSVM